MNIIWDDSTGELHSRWSKIFFSSHVENATLNRCYFMNEINDPVDTIQSPDFLNAFELAYGDVLILKVFIILEILMLIQLHQNLELFL